MKNAGCDLLDTAKEAWHDLVFIISILEGEECKPDEKAICDLDLVKDKLAKAISEAEEKRKNKKIKSFEEYQQLAYSTAIYPNKGSSWFYPVLGLEGEAGKVAEKFKKILRDDDGKISVEKRKEIGKELGDVLWYINAVCSEIGLKLEDVASDNIEKLFDRRKRGKLSGSGDNR